ncbi:MAG TPA: DUF4292 domain-containing protein [Bacteroidia bacterium]
MNNKVLTYILIAIAFLQACKSRKETVLPPVVEYNKDSATKVVTANSLLNSTLSDWTYFSSKVEVEMNDKGNTINATAHIRMYRDSLIWISAGMFGIEGYRMLITKDSIVVLDKLHKNYSVVKRSDFGNVTSVPLTVTQIQNLILARPVYALNLYEIAKNDSLSLEIFFNQDKFKTNHHYARQYLTIDSTTVKDNSTGNNAKAQYSEYSVIEGKNFPIKNHITASSEKQNFDIKLQHSDVDFSSLLTFPFNIPTSYEKIK